MAKNHLTRWWRCSYKVGPAPVLDSIDLFFFFWYYYRKVRKGNCIASSLIASHFFPFISLYLFINFFLLFLFLVWEFFGWTLGPSTIQSKTIHQIYQTSIKLVSFSLVFFFEGGNFFILRDCQIEFSTECVGSIVPTPEPPPLPPSSPHCRHSRRNPIHLVFWYRRSFVCFCRCPRRGATKPEEKEKKETSWSIEHMIYKSNLSVPFRFRFLFYTRNYYFHFFILFFLFEMWPGQMVVWRESGFITTIRIEKHGGLVNYLSLSLTHTILWFVVIYLPCTVRKCTHLLLNRCHLAASSSMIFLNGSRRFYFPNECRWYRLVLFLLFWVALERDQPIHPDNPPWKIKEDKKLKHFSVLFFLPTPSHLFN